MSVIAFIFLSLMTAFLLWLYKNSKRKEEEGEVMLPPSQVRLYQSILCFIATVFAFLEMTGLMEPLKAWLQSIE